MDDPAIHSLAVVNERARLGPGIRVGPFAVIEAGVEIGPACRIAPHAVIKRGTRLGEGVVVGEHAVLAGLPQDLHFDASKETFLEVGDGTVIREGVTLNRATQEGQATRVGKHCYLMANSHAGHDCVMGDHVVMANDALLAGFVTLGNNVFMGGGAAIHQFTRAGEGAIIGGHASISRDVGPFTMVVERDATVGLNLVGLKRRQVSREAIRELKELFRRVYAERGGMRKRAEQLSAKTPEGQLFLKFYAEGKRGFCPLQRDEREDTD